MRDYQTNRSKSILPNAVYRKTIWQIRDYNRLKENLKDRLEESKGSQEVGGKTNRPSSPVETKAIKRERDRDIVSAIDRALETIPQEYRTGVWQSVMYNAPYPSDAAVKTYSRYKEDFVIMAAINLKFI